MAIDLTHRDAARSVTERRRLGDMRKGRTKGQPLRARMLDYDVKFLHAVLNWGVSAGYLERNPLKGFRVEREESPQRPILTAAQYDQLLAVGDQIDPLFRLALVVSHETGHRISAVRQLRWSDVELGEGVVRWRGESDKRKYEHQTPLTPTALEALKAARQARPGIGDSWIFPVPGRPTEAISRHLLRDWWQRAELKAKLAPESRWGWHSLRRKFATELKHAPLKDLCALGGWKDHQTILTCYQCADAVTMRQALETRMRLESV